jgi:branched-chain amino acid transport system ATP-binding protein
MSMLKVENLVCKYGEVIAVDNISLEIEKGEIVALIGGNGAGKTTTLMTISGWLKCTSGIIKFNGEEFQNQPMHKIVNL